MKGDFLKCESQPAPPLNLFIIAFLFDEVAKGPPSYLIRRLPFRGIPIMYLPSVRLRNHAIDGVAVRENRTELLHEILVRQASPLRETDFPPKPTRLLETVVPIDFRGISDAWHVDHPTDVGALVKDNSTDPEILSDVFCVGHHCLTPPLLPGHTCGG